MSKATKFTIIILSLLSVILICANITLALMNDRKVNTGIIQFKQHKLDIEIVGNDSIVLSPEELNLGSIATRTINISNPTNSSSCVFRMWLEFYVDNNINTEYLSFNVEGSNFLKSESDKYYYKGVLSSGGKLNNVALKFSVSTNLSSEYQGKPYNLKLFIESIQSTKGAVLEEWQNDYTTEWLNSVYDSLT